MSYCALAFEFDIFGLIKIHICQSASPNCRRLSESHVKYVCFWRFFGGYGKNKCNKTAYHVKLCACYNCCQLGDLMLKFSIFYRKFRHGSNGHLHVKLEFTPCTWQPKLTKPLLTFLNLELTTHHKYDFFFKLPPKICRYIAVLWKGAKISK